MEEDVTSDKNYKVDCWGLPYFVDEWGCETETDEEPVRVTYDNSGIIFVPASITATKIYASPITATSMHGSYVAAPPVPPRILPVKKRRESS